MSDAEIAWAAGFFDGEGCISISHGIYWCCNVSVSQNDREALVAFDDRTGGHGTVRQPQDGKRTWTYTVSGRDNQIDVLAAMLPFLIVKRHQAELALAYLTTVPKHGANQQLSVHDMQLRERIAAELHSLKNLPSTFQPAGPSLRGETVI